MSRRRRRWSCLATRGHSVNERQNSGTNEPKNAVSFERLQWKLPHLEFWMNNGLKARSEREGESENLWTLDLDLHPHDFSFPASVSKRTRRSASPSRRCGCWPLRPGEHPRRNPTKGSEQVHKPKRRCDSIRMKIETNEIPTVILSYIRICNQRVEDRKTHNSYLFRSRMASIE